MCCCRILSDSAVCKCNCEVRHAKAMILFEFQKRDGTASRSRAIHFCLFLKSQNFSDHAISQDIRFAPLRFGSIAIAPQEEGGNGLRLQTTLKITRQELCRPIFIDTEFPLSPGFQSNAYQLQVLRHLLQIRGHAKATQILPEIADGLHRSGPRDRANRASSTGGLFHCF